jgi:hypothetical protein
MDAIAKNGHNSGAGFGAGLYRNLVRFGAIRCNMPQSLKPLWILAIC